MATRWRVLNRRRRRAMNATLPAIRMATPSHRYILNGHRPIPCDDLLKWAQWFETADRHVADDDVNGVRVSTVFLGADHRFGFGSPLLFETMVFGGSLDGAQCRYTSWRVAGLGHKRMMERVRKSERWPEEIDA